MVGHLLVDDRELGRVEMVSYLAATPVGRPEVPVFREVLQEVSFLSEMSSSSSYQGVLQDLVAQYYHGSSN